MAGGEGEGMRRGGRRRRRSRRGGDAGETEGYVEEIFVN